MPEAVAFITLLFDSMIIDSQSKAVGRQCLRDVIFEYHISVANVYFDIVLDVFQESGNENR